MRQIIFLFFLINFFSSFCSTCIIIIPGTWASKETWHTPEGDFFKAVNNVAHQRGWPVVSYAWSGSLAYDARLRAAQGLVHLLLSYPEKTQFIIIAHSHGGNVVYAASQQLYEQGYRSLIKVLYTLGTPCSEFEALPEMHVIDYVYNLFSFADIIQPVQGMYHRVIPDHPHCCNIRVTINSKEPDHGQLHSALVGQWILYIHDYCTTRAKNFALFTYNQPGIIHLSNNSIRYEYDPERTNDLEQDRIFQRDLSVAFYRNRIFSETF